MEHSLKESEKLQRIDKLFDRAEVLRKNCRYKEALLLFKKALKSYSLLNENSGIFRSLSALGDVYRMTGRFNLAADNYSGAIEISGRQKDSFMAADAGVGLGLSHRALGNWEDALFHIRKSKKFYADKKDREGLAFATWAEAGTYRIKGDIEKTIKTYLEAKKIFRSMMDTYGEGYCLCGLGGASRIAGRFRASLKYYQAANKVFSGLKDTFGTAYSYCGIGNAYRMLSDYRTASANFRKASALYEKIGDIVSFSYTLWGIGTSHKMLGDYSNAAVFFNKAMSNFRKTKDPRGMIYCRLALGELALLKGLSAPARKQIEAALDEAKTFRFAIEECYAQTLASFLKDGSPDRGCYKKLGLKLELKELPLNIP